MTSHDGSPARLASRFFASSASNSIFQLIGQTIIGNIASADWHHNLLCLVGIRHYYRSSAGGVRAASTFWVRTSSPQTM